ncbi:MAG: BlaI/MecI/CopY family transcriptional regulator [Aggregatilineales bacterium]
MVNPMHDQLSRRENQIMDLIYQLGEATAADITARLPDPPSNSSVRTLLTILEDKGHLTHRRKGARFVYQPTLPADNAQRSAVTRVVETFFGGSTPRMVAALLSTTDLSESELDELEQLIRHVKGDDPDESTADAD